MTKFDISIQCEECFVGFMDMFAVDESYVEQYLRRQKYVEDLIKAEHQAS